MITGINESKKTNRAYYVKVNVDVPEKNMIHINNGIKINVGASVKTIIYLKKIVKMENISKYYGCFSDYL